MYISPSCINNLKESGMVTKPIYTFMIKKIIQILNNAKMTIGTIAIIGTSMIGGYNFVSEYFVTKTYAIELEKSTYSQINELKNMTKQNTGMIIELRMIKYEMKIEKNQKLTPTEQREYDLLKAQLSTMITDTK